MLTDLVQIRSLGEKQRDENLRFRMHLKRRNFAEPRLKRMAQEIEEEIDCTVCANCCRVATVKIGQRDVDKLVRHLGMREHEFLDRYTSRSEDEGLVLRRDENGCVFLQNGLCSVYDARPRTCVNFPHLARGDGSLVSRMWLMADRACYCPIVYNTLDAWKAETRFNAVSR